MQFQPRGWGNSVPILELLNPKGSDRARQGLHRVASIDQEATYMKGLEIKDLGLAIQALGLGGWGECATFSTPPEEHADDTSLS